jgi:MoxR-like ATPase
LLFPDSFERLTTGRDKRAILATFTGKPVRDVRELSFLEVDQGLYAVRQQLEQQYDTTELDFYYPPLREQWKEAESEDTEVRYWKIAPGNNARLWQECWEGGYIAMGWSETGDVSGFTRTAYAAQQEAYLRAHPDYEADRYHQVWKFAQINVGDRIIANRGTQEVLGVGTVTGPYFFVAGAAYGHRLPVRWDDVHSRAIHEPGWRRTLIEMSQTKFDHITGTANGGTVLSISETPATRGCRYWVEKAYMQGRAHRVAGAYALGQVLLSPQRAQDGRDIYRGMREVQPGDVVLHLTDNAAITGVSRVAGVVREHNAGIPTTDLADRPSYLVPLEAFRQLEPPLTRRMFLESPPWADQLRRLAAAQTGLFFSRTLELNQGAYLTEAPQELVGILNDAYRAQTEQTLPYVPITHAVVEERRDGLEPGSPYRVDDALADLFIDPTVFTDILDTLKAKKNVILQGPPGVGKTFFSKRLAYAVMGEKTEARIGMVQFHPSYTYEDFVQGYRPIAGGFALRNGIFFTFCQRAAADPDHPFVFIIDEINRANLSKVFGELMMLIEADKRGPEWAIPLTYAGADDAPFFVPDNLYMIGLMNTADRSLAMVDYALRRRFAFVDLEPGFQTTQFCAYLQRRGVDDALIQRIVRKMVALNARIAQETTDLGAGFCIGHSFFCAVPRDRPADEVWYQRVIRSEIAPLLREYWFDDSTKADELIRTLRITD